MDTINIACLSLAISIPVIYYVIKYKKYLDRFAKLPNSKIHPFFGHTPGKFVKPLTMMVQIYDGLCALFGEQGMLIVWIIFQPLCILFRAETIEVLMSSVNHLSKSDDYYFLDQWLGGGLLLSRPEKWKGRRRMLTPSFHFKSLARFQPIIDECCRRHVAHWGRRLAGSKDRVMGVKSLINDLTIDIVTESVMGVQLDSRKSESKEFKEAMATVAENFLIRIQRPWLWPNWIHNLSGVGKRFNRAADILNRFGTKVISEKKATMERDGLFDLEDETKDQSFLETLLRYQRTDPDFTETDILKEVNTFLFAGPDTTSANIAFALYLMGLHPEVRDKVHREMMEVMGDDLDHPVTLDDLKGLRYADQVIKESQRLFPPATITGRKLTEDLRIGDKVVPKGTTTWIYYRALHRDPKYFPNPEVFDPDRFSAANGVGRHPMAFIPFSAGPRNCIGQRLASMIVKTTLVHCVRAFQMESTEQRDRFALVNEIVLKPANQLPMKFTPR